MLSDGLKVDSSKLVYDFAQTESVDVLSSLKNLDQQAATHSADIAGLDSRLRGNDSLIASQSAALAQLKANIASLSGSLKFTPPETLLATSSATLTTNYQLLTTTSDATISGQLTAYKLNVSESLKSFGKTTLGSTLIAGDLTIDGTLSITGNSISSLQTLKLQEGRVTIDTNGNIETSGGIKTTKLTITNPPQASGSATLAASIGTAKIPAGQTSVVINTNQVSDKAKIFVTPRAKIGSQALVVESVKSGESFTVSLDHALGTDLEFDWWIVQTE